MDIEDEVRSLSQNIYAGGFLSLSPFTRSKNKNLDFPITSLNCSDMVNIINLIKS